MALLPEAKRRRLHVIYSDDDDDINNQEIHKISDVKNNDDNGQGTGAQHCSAVEFEIDDEKSRKLARYILGLYPPDLTPTTYQLVGTVRMMQNFAQGYGCLLADDPGLGKTFQCVALGIAAQKLDMAKRQSTTPRPFLVVVPTDGVATQWLAVLRRFGLGSSKVVHYCGSHRHQETLRSDTQAVVVSIHTLTSDFRTRSPWFYDFTESRLAFGACPDMDFIMGLDPLYRKKMQKLRTERMRRIPSLIYGHGERFVCAIIDEAHVARIESGRAFHVDPDAVKKQCFHAVRPDLLKTIVFPVTGTPFHNRRESFDSMIWLANPTVAIPPSGDAVRQLCVRRTFCPKVIEQSSHIGPLPKISYYNLEPVPFAFEETKLAAAEQLLTDAVHQYSLGRHNGSAMVLRALQIYRRVTCHPSIVSDDRLKSNAINDIIPANQPISAELLEEFMQLQSMVGTELSDLSFITNGVPENNYDDDVDNNNHDYSLSSDDFTNVVANPLSCKEDMLMRCLRNNFKPGCANEKVVVATPYVDSVKRIMAIIEHYNQQGYGTRIRALPYHGNMSTRERQSTVDALNAGTIEVMIMTSRAGGVGLNLQAAGIFIKFYGVDWNPAMCYQQQGRVARIGGRPEVRVIRIMGKYTCDTWMLSIAKKKSERATEMLACNEGDEVYGGARSYYFADTTVAKKGSNVLKDAATLAAALPLFQQKRKDERAVVY